MLFLFVENQKYQDEILDPNSDAQILQEALDAKGKSYKTKTKEASPCGTGDFPLRMKTPAHPCSDREAAHSSQLGGRSLSSCRITGL